MIEHNKTHMAHTSGLSDADEVALCVRIAHLMDQATAHRHACERLERAYGPTLPQPYKAVYATYYAKREALDAHIRALGSALYPDDADDADSTDKDEGAEDERDMDDLTRAQATHKVSEVAARIMGYVGESDADSRLSIRDEWWALVVAFAWIGGAAVIGAMVGKVARRWR